MSSLRISKRALIIIVVILAVLGAIVGGYWYVQRPKADPNEVLRDPQTGLTPAEEQRNEEILLSSDHFNGTVEQVDLVKKQIFVRQGDSVLALNIDDKTRIGKGIDYQTITLSDIQPGAEVATGFWKESKFAYEVWLP